MRSARFDSFGELTLRLSSPIIAIIDQRQIASDRRARNFGGDAVSLVASHLTVVSAKGRRLLSFLALFVGASNVATAQQSNWELLNDTALICTVQTEPMPALHQEIICNSAVNLISRTNGNLYLCTGFASEEQINGKINTTTHGSAQCKLVSAPPTPSSSTTIYSGSVNGLAPIISPPGQPTTGGSAYWTAQRENWNVFLCLQLPGAQSDCFAASRLQ
jgi:hypothetical protein